MLRATAAAASVEHRQANMKIEAPEMPCEGVSECVHRRPKLSRGDKGNDTLAVSAR